VSAAGEAVPAEGAIDIGDRLELFVDDYLIESFAGNAELRLHSPTMREVAMVCDKPWEGNTSGCITVFQDGDLYRMYYRGWRHKNKKAQVHPAVTCYAESEDGINWVRTNLGLFEYEGSKDNNIVWTREPETHNFTPFLDTNPGAKPDEKYKAVGGLKGGGGLFGLCSADGVRWRRVSEEPILTDGAFDSQNLVFWDSVRGEYRAYYRDFRDGFRDIKTVVSKDFHKWPNGVWLEYPGAPKEHLYVNGVLPCPRAPHLFVGFPTRFFGARGDIVEPLFMTSRDGRTFHRWGEAIIRPGLNKERWLNRSNYIFWGLIKTQSNLPGGPKELSLFTNERYYEDGKGAVHRRFTYRMDGFASVHAPLSGGEVLTRPLTFSGNRLRLNVSTSAAGSVRVEVQNAAGNPIQGLRAADCPDIWGDDIEREVEWSADADVGRLQGQPVRLRFVLKDADVYAFQFVR
jgi:hypothetical protein